MGRALTWIAVRGAMSMRNFCLPALILAFAGTLSGCAETHFTYAELLSSRSVKATLDPTVTLYWAAQPTPDFQEVTRPMIYARSGLSMSPFGGSARHCVEGFERALAAMIGDAGSRGYDAIIHLQVVRNGQPSDDPAGFDCKPGYKLTSVALSGTFAMSPLATQRAAEAEQRTANLPPRDPAVGAIFLPLEPILTSAEAKTILGPGIDVYWGVEAPAYGERYGPEEYSEEAETKTSGREEACRQAVLKTLGSMVDDARDGGYRSIIKVRSFLNKWYAPVPTDVECLLTKKEARVTLQASVANKR